MHEVDKWYKQWKGFLSSSEFKIWVKLITYSAGIPDYSKANEYIYSIGK